MRPSKKRLLLLQKIIRQPFHDPVSGQSKYHRFRNDERELCLAMERDGLVSRLGADKQAFSITVKGQHLFEEMMGI